MDIDFGFKEAPAGKSETIADCVRKKHYGEHHLSMDRSVPFVPVVHLGKEDMRADVEFITSPETSETVRKKLVGQEIKVSEIEDFEILGVPTIVLQRFCREWRWFDETITGDKCPWYPSVENFTQRSPGDWPNVLLRLRQRLIGML